MSGTIETIRAEVQKVREGHVPVIEKRHSMLPPGPETFTLCSHCGNGSDFPCPTLLLAEDKLKLAEAIADVLLDGHGLDELERVLESVSR